MNSSIKSKLYAGFGVILVLLGALATLMISNLSDSNTRLDRIVNVSANRILFSQGLLAGVLEASRQEKNLILENDPARMRRYEDKLSAALAVIRQNLSDLQPLVTGEEKDLLQKFTVSWNKYEEYISQIVELASKNEDEKAFGISINQGYSVREEAIQVISSLVEKSRTRMTEAKAKNDSSYTSSITIILIMFGLTLLAAISIAAWIVTSIGKRITFISDEATAIASRENPETTITDRSRDELSPIVKALAAINESFREITKNANRVASGDYSMDFVPRSDRDILGRSLAEMTRSLRASTAENAKHAWLSGAQNQLNEKLRGDKDVNQLAAETISFLCSHLNVPVGALYLPTEQNTLSIKGAHAVSREKLDTEIRFGEGLVGQVALEKKPIWLKHINKEQLLISSSIVSTGPVEIGIYPLLFGDRLFGVIEIGALEEFTVSQREFMLQSAESIAISISSANSRTRIRQLLEESQAQGEELQSQQEELRQLNEELEEQSHSLRQQQEELQMTNEELEEQTQALEAKNREVEMSRLEVEEKSRQLESSSRYKSEFLANMSHELRTPLNALLILSKDLTENKTGNLTADQVESAEIINKSGQELLALINEVLDLSKIEAGKMNVTIDRINLGEFVNSLYRGFKRHAENKHLEFRVNLDEDLPKWISSDSQRLNQILKNLLSNAIKFTTDGRVTLNVSKTGADKISFMVSDTGIGIPDDKQQTIFEAFQQGDGGTSRKYGGTGLGLSISRQLAKLLQGDILLSSKAGEGSVFTPL
jgi:signal transduction histidine kinase/CHASE3 domain sensor protein